MGPFQLFDAAFANDAAAIDEAVAQGADPTASHPRGGHTPLSVASGRGAALAVSALLNQGAKPDQRFEWKSQVDGRTCGGRSALMSASTAEVAELLLHAGAPVDDADANGWTALIHAADKGYLDVFELLLSSGADPFVTISDKGERLDVGAFIDRKVQHLVKVGGKPTNPKIEKFIQDLQTMKVGWRKCSSI